RVHYPQNNRPRLADAPHDCLYLISRSRFTLYDSIRHRQWELRADSSGRLTVGVAGGSTIESDDAALEVDVESPRTPASLAFPWETHLRDFLARNLHTLPLRNRPLRLYQEENATGIEFQTDVGRIDLLAIDTMGELVVFELKLGRGPDYTIGQILRYMGWVRQNIGLGKQVRGVIIAQTIDDKLRYAASEIPAVQLLEYEVQFTIREAD
ncbi:MAG: DUF91 domain-containing protein, partial [Dehalococcoidia bacterium]|nr:DUF91 domain-containing protein [Dehalococcoidia bacterium]